MKKAAHMYSQLLGCHLVKYNPIYAVGDKSYPRQKPSEIPLVRWDFYKLNFHNIYPHVR